VRLISAEVRRPVPLVLAGCAAVIGVVGVVRPSLLAALAGCSDETARALAQRDLGNALLFTLADERTAVAQRVAYDLGDALQFGRRRPLVGVAALAGAALGAVEHVAGRR
jgi:hypothetical protein